MVDSKTRRALVAFGRRWDKLSVDDRVDLLSGVDIDDDELIFEMAGSDWSLLGAGDRILAFRSEEKLDRWARSGRRAK